MIEIKKLGESPKLARSLELTRDGKKLVTPTYFPAISGTQHNFRISNLLANVAGSSYPRVLISAYDFSDKADPTFKASMKQLGRFRKKDPWMLLDSGIFESSRLKDEDWSFSRYSKVIKEIQSDLYFAFDAYPQAKMTNTKYAKATMEGISRSEGLESENRCIPVIHGRTPSQLLFVAKSLVRESPKEIKLLAVPERECGSTLLQRAGTIIKLRKMLDSQGEVFLHMLGCGNPVSMGLYVYCGADSFDSLDWVEQYVDRSSRGFRDLSHVDVVECACKVCELATRSTWSRIDKALFHNLLFYQDFSLQLQEMVSRNTLRDFLLEFMKGSVLEGIGK